MKEMMVKSDCGCESENHDLSYGEKTSQAMTMATIGPRPQNVEAQD
jgi:hypothetical protein